MNENESIHNPDMPSYASSGYLDWLHPGLDAEKQARQLEIHKRMSQMLVESYWRQIGYNREQWLKNLPETD